MNIRLRIYESHIFELRIKTWLCHSFANLTVARKASDVSAADWRYQSHVKKITEIVHVWIYDFSQGKKSFLNIL